MGKVFVVGLGESSSTLGYLIGGNYFHLTPWFLRLIFAEECPGNFLDIHTSKAFNTRGDKDCRHRSVEGLITFSSPGYDASMQTTTFRLPEAWYWEIDEKFGYTQDMTVTYLPLSYPGRVERESFYLQTTLFLDVKSGRPQNRLRSFTRRRLSWVESIIDDYNGACTDDEFTYEFIPLSGRDWDYVVHIKTTRTYHPKDEGTLSGKPAPYSIDGGTVTQSCRIQARENKRYHYMEYTYVESNGFTAKLSYEMPIAGVEIPWYYSRDGVLDKVSKLVKAAAKRPMEVLVSLTKPSNLPNATKKRLVKNALDDVRSLRINSIAYLQDLVRLKELWKPLKKLKRQPWKLKNWTNAWLTYRYGIRLFMLDTLEVMKAFENQSGKPSDLTHIRSVWRTTPTTPLEKDVELITHCKVLFNFKESRTPVKVTQCLRNWDLILSRENIWDFIPYSFVLDWVLPVGEYLADLDAESDLTLYKSDTAIFSQKASYRLEGSFNHMLDIAEYNDGDGEYWLEPIWGSCNISLNISSYYRWHENPRYVTSPLEFSNGLNLVRTVDAVALTVQRKK